MLFKLQLQSEEKKAKGHIQLLFSQGCSTQVWYGNRVIVTWALRLNLPWRLKNVSPGTALCWTEFSISGCIHGSHQSPADGQNHHKGIFLIVSNYYRFIVISTFISLTNKNCLVFELLHFLIYCSNLQLINLTYKNIQIHKNGGLHKDNTMYM